MNNLINNIRNELKIEVEIIVNKISSIEMLNDIKQNSINKVFVFNKELMIDLEPHIKEFGGLSNPLVLIYKQTKYYINDQVNLKTLFVDDGKCYICYNEIIKAPVKCGKCTFICCTPCKSKLYISEYFTSNKVLCPYCRHEFIKERDESIIVKIL